MAGDETVRIDTPDPALRGLGAGGRVFGRYTLEAVAGRGGMGVVWRAHDNELERTVALKFLPEAVASDPEAVRDLKRETKRCLELTHPHIVRVYDFVQDGAIAAIAMEFVDGESLAKRKAESAGGCLPAGEIAPLVAELCAALDYAHTRARVVHRDLKPANLLVTRTGELKITDFGIARSLTESRTRLTGQSSTSGTLPYMSPQQLAGDKPSETDDIYALGATIYDLLTGKPPFYRGDMASMIIQIRERLPAPLEEHRIDAGCEGAAIPDRWAKVVIACLDKNAAGRPRSAGEVAQRLGLAAPPGTAPMSSTPVVVETPAPVVPPPPPIPARAPLAASVPGVPSAAKIPAPSAPPPLLPDVSGQASSVAATPAPATIPPAAGPASPVAPRRHGPAILIGAAALLAAAAGFYFGFYRPQQQKLAGERRVAEEKRLSDAREKAEAARALAEQEEQVFNEIARGIDSFKDGAPAGERAAIDEMVRSYLQTASPKYRAEIDRRWNERLAGWDAARRAAARGGLIISTTPAGAEVVVGALAAQKSPVTLPQMRLGSYPIVARLPGYEEFRVDAEVKENEFTTVDLPLVRSMGGAQIASNPPGLAFTLQGADLTRTGTTPAHFDRLPTGDYTLIVRRQGWPDLRQTVTVARESSVAAVAEFVTGDLEITSDPAGAEVWSKGRRLGETPVHLPDLKPAAFDFELRLPGYKNAAARAEVRPRETAQLAVTLEKIRGPRPGESWTVPGSNLELVWIQPGTFAMGTPAPPIQTYAGPPPSSSSNDANAAAAALVSGIVGIARGLQALQHANESPQTVVHLTQGYWLGRTEVTQTQYESVTGRNPSQFKTASGDVPVENVSWEDAMEFCRRLTERERAAGRITATQFFTLPTEAQWEYACRAGTTGAFAGSIDVLGWYDGNSGGATHPVARKQPNAWGFYDMHGNVSEWCLDAFAMYPGGTVTDYVSSASGGARVHRGGNWKGAAENAHSASRVRERGNARSGFVGFRVALVQSR